LGQFWWALQWKMSVYFKAIRLIFTPCYGHLVYFVVIWCIFPVFGMLYQKNLATPRRLWSKALICWLR
jgi:hypothetical protein